jgi:hypothetical protein
MPPTYLVIIGILVALIIATMAVVLFSPMTVRTEFFVSPENRRATLFFSWIHPFIALVTWSAGDAGTRIRFFGRIWGKPSREEPSPMVSPEPVTTARPVSRPQPEPIATPQAEIRDTSAARSQTVQEPPSAVAPPSAYEKSEEVGKADTDTRQTFSTRMRATRVRFSSFYQKARITWRVLRRHRMTSRISRWCLRVLSLTLRLIRFDHARIFIQAGMEDPARLGKIYGWYVALNRVVFGVKKNIDLRFEPRFQQSDLALDGSIGLRTSIARMIAPAVVGVLTFPWIRALFVWWRLRKVYKSAPSSDTITGRDNAL